jgi:O-antigen ligase
MGSGKLVPAHNDYLRSLVTNGIIGVTIYIIVLLLIGFLVIKNALKKMTPLNIVAVFF